MATPTTSRELKHINSAKSFFTPCRQIGLSRKSLIKRNTDTPDGQSGILRSNNSEANLTPRVGSFSFKRKSLCDNENSISNTKKSHNDDLKVLHMSDDEDKYFFGFPSPEKNITYDVKELYAQKKKSEILKKIGVSEIIFKGRSSASDINKDDVDKLIVETTDRIENKKRAIKELQVISSNTMKHNLGELKTLIECWQNACQEALKELLNAIVSNGRMCTMPLLLQSLKIPEAVVRYSEEKSDFC